MITIKNEDNLNENISLVEMAIINPKMCKQLSIQVEVEQRDEGPVPHVHVYLDKTRNKKNCSFVRLDKPEYCTHHKDGKPLNRKQKTEFIELMNHIAKGAVIYDKDGNMLPANGYQSAVMIWSETYEDGDLSKFTLDENGLIVTPDYSNL